MSGGYDDGCSDGFKNNEVSHICRYLALLKYMRDLDIFFEESKKNLDVIIVGSGGAGLTSHSILALHSPGVLVIDSVSDLAEKMIEEIQHKYVMPEKNTPPGDYKLSKNQIAQERGWDHKIKRK